MPDNSKDKLSVGSPSCFVIMPISDHPEYPIGHFTRVYNDLIKPAVEDAGFKCKRVDDDIETKIIILNILKMVTECDMAICDMSSLNPNVMYELGIRQMAKKPVTLIKDQLTRRIFDTSILSDIEYDNSLRIDLVHASRERISASLKKTYEQRDSETNSLLDLLNVQLQLSKEKLDVSLPEKLILDRLEGLSLQISDLSKSGSVLGNPVNAPLGAELDNRFRDRKGQRISLQTLLMNPVGPIFYIVGGFGIVSENGLAYAQLSVKNLLTNEFETLRFNTIDIPLNSVIDEDIKFMDKAQFQNLLNFRANHSGS